MSKEKAGGGLGNFKISDAVKKPVGPTSAAQAAGAANAAKKKPLKEEPAPSAGFPNIEKLIEADTLDRSGFQLRRDALEQVSKTGDNKEKAGARKALLAYDQVDKLLDYLWDTKAALAGGGSKPAPEAKPAAKAPAKPAAKPKK